MTTEEEFRWADTNPATTPIADGDTFVCELVTLVAEVRDVDPTDLPPLAEEIDPEAVQATLQSGTADTTKVGFEYAGCEVLVTGAGELFVWDASAETSE